MSCIIANMSPSHSDPPAQSVSPTIAGSAPPDRRRPIITSLNGDNSWLLSFPYPTTATDSPAPEAAPNPADPSSNPRQKAYYHIAFDPWLNGPAKLITPLFGSFTQPHQVAITSGAGVEDVARQIETAALYSTTIYPPSSSEDETKSGPSPIDAILLTFNATDHMHEPTLRTFSPSIPVFCPDHVAAIVRGWGYFDTVIVTKDYDPAPITESGDRDEDAWRSLRPGDDGEDGGLPPWLSFFRVQGSFFLNLAFAVVYSSASPSRGESHEALLFVPHGIKVDAPAIGGFLEEWGDARKDVRKSVLGLFHALHESFTMGVAVTYGVVGGLALDRLARPRYWVKSHHALLVPGGVFPWLSWIKDVARTLTWGLEQEKKAEKGVSRSREPNVVEVENGGCFVLE
ncbi:hypothetical protein QBC39DRAFT_355813 [Podospora conica]|nr:hypothetical protein QBC39DRAFT_355813 [Schizothecium conicum]